MAPEEKGIRRKDTRKMKRSGRERQVNRKVFMVYDPETKCWYNGGLRFTWRKNEKTALKFTKKKEATKVVRKYKPMDLPDLEIVEVEQE